VREPPQQTIAAGNLVMSRHLDGPLDVRGRRRVVERSEFVTSPHKAYSNEFTHVHRLMITAANILVTIVGRRPDSREFGVGRTSVSGNGASSLGGDLGKGEYLNTWDQLRRGDSDPAGEIVRKERRGVSGARALRAPAREGF